MKIKIIGDCHGKFDRYEQLIKYYNTEHSIQIGDFGLGVAWSKLDRHKVDSENNKIIPGNHDDYNYIINSARAKEWTFGNDYGIQNFNGLEFFFVRGAWSIDKANRTPTLDWWEEEELSAGELEQAIELYVKTKPEIMITHECPGDSINGISSIIFLKHNIFRPNRTASALQRMWEIHKPKLWIFGHWHETGNWEVLGTEFVCLGELDYIDYEIGDTVKNSVDWNIVKIREQIKKIKG